MIATAAMLVAVGLAAGVLAGLFGIGGGLIIVPALAWWLIAGDTPHAIAIPVAVATSLGTMLLTAPSAVWFHQRRGTLDWHCIARLGPAVAVGAGFGAALAIVAPAGVIARVFAVIAALTGIRMILASTTRVATTRPRPRMWPLAGPLIGALSAMIGIGGGTFNVPYLARNGYPMVQAVGIASACGWPIALGGAVVFALAPVDAAMASGMLGHLWLPGVALIGIGGVLGAPTGVKLAHRLSDTRLRRLFGAVLVVVALRMAW